MFCPLCKAQRRPGFSLCSECGADLVNTKAQADDAKVRLFWSGNDQSVFSKLLGLLKEADVPNYSTSLAEERFPSVSTLVPLNFRRHQQHRQFSSQIFILEADRLRARHMVRDLTGIPSSV
jgi:predicted amidophosphoribosyltransferase